MYVYVFIQQERASTFTFTGKAVITIGEMPEKVNSQQP